MITAQGLELLAVGRLRTGQREVERQAIEVALDVDLGAEPSAGTTKRLLVLPPFAPAAETCARAVALSNIWISPAVWPQAARAWKKASNVPFRDSREKRFQMEFQLPNCSGKARQVMLWTEK